MVLGSEISTTSAPASLIIFIPFCQSSSISFDMPSTLYSLGIPIFLPLIESFNLAK